MQPPKTIPSGHTSFNIFSRGYLETSFPAFIVIERIGANCVTPLQLAQPQAKFLAGRKPTQAPGARAQNSSTIVHLQSVEMNFILWTLKAL
jgi:hypothetical protein